LATTIIVISPDETDAAQKEVKTVHEMFVGQAAIEVSRQLSRAVTPREITALFYDWVVPPGFGPIVSGRRLISPEANALIVAALRKKDAGRQQPEGGSVDQTA